MHEIFSSKREIWKVVTSYQDYLVIFGIDPLKYICSSLKKHLDFTQHVIYFSITRSSRYFEAVVNFLKFCFVFCVGYVIDSCKTEQEK